LAIKRNLVINEIIVWVLKSSIFAYKISPSGRFSATKFVFMEKSFPTDQNLEKRGAILLPPCLPASLPKRH